MVPCPRTPFSRIPLLSRTIPKKDPISQEGLTGEVLGTGTNSPLYFVWRGGQLAPVAAPALKDLREMGGGILT